MKREEGPSAALCFFSVPLSLCSLVSLTRRQKKYPASPPRNKTLYVPSLNLSSPVTARQVQVLVSPIKGREREDGGEKERRKKERERKEKKRKRRSSRAKRCSLSFPPRRHFHTHTHENRNQNQNKNSPPQDVGSTADKLKEYVLTKFLQLVAGNSPVPLSVCSGEYALCAASTCKPTGANITLNSGVIKPEVVCRCPILKGPAIAELTAGNMQVTLSFF